MLPQPTPQPARFHYVKGNIFEAEVESLVCPVNCVGVMGKGLALDFKKRFPFDAQYYEAYCKSGKLKPGRCCSSGSVATGRTIIYAATKDHWRDPSALEWVRGCLEHIREVAGDLWMLNSIAIPALGCGLGGLTWAEVRPLYEEILGMLTDIDIVVYEPNS